MASRCGLKLVPDVLLPLLGLCDGGKGIVMCAVRRSCWMDGWTMDDWLMLIPLQ